MQKHFFKILPVKKEESLFLVILFFQAFSIGALLSSFDIITHTLFISNYDISYLPMVFIASGAFGIFLFLFYMFFLRRMHHKLFSTVNLILISASIIFYAISFNYFDKDHVIFGGLVIMFPITLITLLNFWRSVRKLLSQEQNNRLSPIIELGLTAGIVIVSYSIVILLYSFDYPIILLICKISVISSLFLQLLIIPVHNRSKNFPHQKEKYVPVKINSFAFSSKYTTFLFFFALTSAITYVLIHFSFLSSTAERFGANVQGIGKFFGLFVGTLYLFILFVDKILTPRILYSYNSPYSLIVVPVATLLICLFSLLIYVSSGSTNTLGISTFFMLISVTKIVYEALKYSIQIPSLRVLFNSLDIRFRQYIFPRVEGVIVITGFLCSGLLLILLNQIKFNKPSVIILIIIVFIIVWIFISFKLIKQFQLSLHNILVRLKVAIKTKETPSGNIHEKYHSLINNQSEERVINTLSLLEINEPMIFENELKWLVNNSPEYLKKFVIKKIEEHAVLEALPEIDKLRETPNASYELELDKIAQRFKRKLSLIKDESNLKGLINSRNTVDRILAADIIGSAKQNQYSSALINLIRDIEPDVIDATLRAMARLGNPDHSYLLIGYLSSSLYYSYAFDALVKIGDPALDYLEQVFNSPNTDNEILSRIVRIYGRINSQKSIDLLLGKIENQNRIIARQAIAALSEAKYHAGSTNINRILNVIARTTGIIAWNFASYHYLGNSKKYNILKEAYQIEIEENYNTLFYLLSLAYNSNTIFSIKEMILNGSNTDISYGIELIDQFIHEDIKNVLFPILENIPVKEKVKKLQYYFAIEKMTPEEIILSTITRDYNQISLYPKACAMLNWLEIKKMEITPEIVSIIFHPNKFLRETSAFVLNNIDNKFIDSISDRLDNHIYNEIKTALDHTQYGQPYMVIDKFYFLKKVTKFSNLTEEVLLKLADSLSINKLQEDETITLNTERYAMIILIIGSVRLELDEQKLNYKKYDVFFPAVIENSAKNKLKLTGIRSSTFYSIDKEIFKTVIFDNLDITNSVLEYIKEY